LDYSNAQNQVVQVEQQSQTLIQNIRTLEAQLQTHPNPSVQPRGWTSSGGGGFLGNLTAGLGMGAGFGLAEDAINGIFNAL